MKYNIIKTDNYLLVVNDEEIKYDDHYIDEYKMLFILKNGDVTKHKNPKKVIAHLSLNNSSILEGVNLLPPLEDDVEKLAEDMYREFPNNPKDKPDWKYNRDENCFKKRKAFVKGYNKAQEIYKWTDEDIANAIIIAKDSMGVDNDGETCYSHLSTKQIIESLQQPKYPIAFEYEFTKLKTKDLGNGFFEFETPRQTQWVGKYIF